MLKLFIAAGIVTLVCAPCRVHAQAGHNQNVLAPATLAALSAPKATKREALASVQMPAQRTILATKGSIRAPMNSNSALRFGPVGVREEKKRS